MITRAYQKFQNYSRECVIYLTKFIHPLMDDGKGRIIRVEHALLPWTLRCIVVRWNINLSFVNPSYVLSSGGKAIILIFRSSDSKKTWWRSKERVLRFSSIIFLPSFRSKTSSRIWSKVFIYRAIFILLLSAWFYIYISASIHRRSRSIYRYERKMEKKAPWGFSMEALDQSSDRSFSF